jgi:osmotically inducible protein OsmC
MAKDALSKASATWEGDLVHGKGSFSLASGAAGPLPITWAARVERLPGSTSPEEMIAGAHAACYAMAFSNVLGGKGTPATRLDVSATVSFAMIEGGAKIAKSALVVKGSVPGLDQAGFAEAAKQAEQGCPVSNALRNNVEISVDATLE